MDRKWCIPVLIRTTASEEEAELVFYCLAMARVDWEREDAGFSCYGDASEKPEEARKRIYRELRHGGVEHAVVTPLRILRWDDERSMYVNPSVREQPDRRDRTWCLPLPVGVGAPVHEKHLIRRMLEQAGFDAESDEYEVLCFVDAGKKPEDVRRRLVRFLRDSGFEHAVAAPVPILRWDDERQSYIDPDAPDRPEPLHPADVGWKVSVVGADAFSFARLRDEIADRARPIIEERDWQLDVGARNEPDARALAEDLEALPIVASAVPEKLSAFGRWQVRQKLLGNYGVDWP